MCGRFTQQRSDHELAEWFEAEQLVDDPGGRFNVAPTDPVSIVVEKDERRALTAYRWGLVPFWAKDRSIGSRMINARAETLATNNAFRDSFAHRRCLVPADGFYEWRRDPGRRQPFVIHRLDGAPLAFAGLWAGWRDRETGEVLRTMTIVTTGAERAHGARSTTGCRSSCAPERLGPLARPVARGHRRAAGPPRAGTRWRASRPIPSRRSSTTSATTARS